MSHFIKLALGIFLILVKKEKKNHEKFYFMIYFF